MVASHFSSACSVDPFPLLMVPNEDIYITLWGMWKHTFIQGSAFTKACQSIISKEWRRLFSRDCLHFLLFTFLDFFTLVRHYNFTLWRSKRGIPHGHVTPWRQINTGYHYYSGWIGGEIVFLLKCNLSAHRHWRDCPAIAPITSASIWK